MQSESPNVTSNALPAVSDIAPVPNERHKSAGIFPTKFVKTPLLPAGIKLPVNEKPSTVSPPVETVKPASAAKPPLALVIDAPTASN